jgi:aryl-alcohol dehydrogenase-like predicted oxidoreductase
MRRVNFAPLSRSVSAIGFGCASLGSRVDARSGSSALARAYDAGVSWFDVAPSYGDGHAEGLLGAFLAGKHSQVTVCTKVGVLPSRVSFPMRIAKPFVQRTIAFLPGLRRHVVKFRPPTQPVDLTGLFVECSIVESLRRLQMDYVDVLALHDARLADVQRDDVLRALDNVVRKGYARTISLAGDLSVSLAAVTLLEHVSVIQVANNLFLPNLALAKQQLPSGRSMHFVTHGVFGQHGSLDTLASMIAKEADKRTLLDAAGYRVGAREDAAAFLLDFALASNPDGVVLLSMYQPSHLSSNLGRLTSSPPPDVVLDLANRLVALHACPGRWGKKA